MTGLLNPESLEIDYFFCMILIVYLRHGVFIRRQFFFSPNQFWGEVLSSRVKELQKKTVHLYRMEMPKRGTSGTRCAPLP